MKVKIAYQEAFLMADLILEALKPHCPVVMVAGSVRREKMLVGDIEIVCIPYPYETGIFQDGFASVVNQWKKVKGELEYGKNKIHPKEVSYSIIS